MIKEQLLKKGIWKGKPEVMLAKKSLIFLIFFLVFININVNAAKKSVVDITRMDISEINEALDLGLITSEELVNLYLERIETYDKQYNSIITINEKALEQAKELDKERMQGKVRSSLHGIPIVVKDNIDVEGMPTTGGTKSLKDNYPKTSAFAVQKLIDAGAIILAKTNMSELAIYASSSISSYGTVKNAYNTDYSPYGSSGGSAVAVAASFASAALGTDTNSSIRLPASANNLVGLRPSFGLVSNFGLLPYDVTRDTIGTLTKTVNDSMLIMTIINGYDQRDESSINQESRKYGDSKVELKNITLGIPEKFLNGSETNGLPENKETYSEINKLMKEAIDKLEKAGAKIEYIDEYYTFQTDGWVNSSYGGYLFCDSFNKYIKNTTGTIRDFQGLNSSNAKIASIDDYSSSCDSNPDRLITKDSYKASYRDYVNAIMIEKKVDVILYPTTKNKLLKINDSNKLLNLSAHASSTINYPSITLPLGFDSDGLPYGVEIMAPTYNEELLYGIALVYEKINGNDDTPEISPSLYTISDEVQKLVSNYRKIKTKNTNIGIIKNWMNNTTDFFRNYSENESANEQAKTLNSKYDFVIITGQILNIGLLLLKWILIIFLSLLGLIILLLIRKYIRRKIRRMRKKHKSRKLR